MQTRFILLRTGLMTGTSEPGKEYSDSLKSWEFLEKPRNYKLLKKGGLSACSLHTSTST